jgi:glycerophosphoryl diester phosphodiesterase
MLELDCHLTKDDQVVVHHDFSVNRTTGEDGFIRDINYDVSPYHQSQIKRKIFFI